MKIVHSILITALLLSSCVNKDDYICNTYINIDLDLSLPEYSDLTALDNSIFIEGGCAGIIIYHFATNEYKVYDRNCSYEPSLACSFIDSEILVLLSTIFNDSIANSSLSNRMFVLALQMRVSPITFAYG